MMHGCWMACTIPLVLSALVAPCYMEWCPTSFRVATQPKTINELECLMNSAHDCRELETVSKKWSKSWYNQTSCCAHSLSVIFRVCHCILGRLKLNLNGTNSNECVRQKRWDFARRMWRLNNLKQCVMHGVESGVKLQMWSCLPDKASYSFPSAILKTWLVKQISTHSIWKCCVPQRITLDQFP